MRRFDYRLLGPLEVQVGDELLPLGAAKQRAVLAILLLRLNRTVSTDQLIEHLWPDKPPGRPQTAIQGYISGLRKLLGRESIETSGGGYTLHAGPEQLDLNRFEQLLRQGRERLALQRHEQAALRLRKALDLWRGPALADFTYEAWAQEEIARLEDLRMVTREELAEAQLALGHHGELVAELETLVSEHPLRERPRGQLMLALYRSGRQAEALDTYQRARERLLDDLGIDPCPALQALYKQILNQDEALTVASRGARPETNLPVPPNTLIGRERELGEVRGLLRDPEVRLLTLTGPGGTGKTRLALALGLELLDEFPNGAFFVGLASLVDPALVAPTIAQALGVKERGGEPLPELLCEHLADKHLLLLVDNCEHLLQAAPLLSELLEAAPNLTVLATSRERLRLSGEHEFPLAPLAEEQALELFVARARAAQPGFALDGNRAVVGDICRRLDGLPLALELAAARIRVLSPQALLARLEHRLPLLTAGARDLPERQRTLRATIAWSFELLEREEQELFARLSVFAGGCTLEAAEEVCEADLDALASLVEKNLLQQSGDRFWMLATMREYALERLEDSGEAGLRRRHAKHFLELARKAEEGLRGADEAIWLDVLEAEHDNLRAVLLRDDGNIQLKLAGTLWRFWSVRGHLEEGSRWLQMVLERDSDERALRAKALHGAASLALYRADLPWMRACADEALELFEDVGDKAGIARALLDVANAATLGGEYERAQALFERCRAAALEAGDRRYVVLAIANLGDLALVRGDWEQALELSSEALTLSRRWDFQELIAQSLDNAALASFRLRRFDDAGRKCREGLELARQLGAGSLIANWLVLPAALAAAQGRFEEAFCLLVMAEREIEAGASPLFAAERSLYEETLPLLRARLDPEKRVEAKAAAEGRSFDEAVTYALESLNS
jgi:predicted ATPase/DNA-binding SARP family transcriptional activator